MAKYARFEDGLARESVISIERISSCQRQAQGQSAAEVDEKRRDCIGRAG